MDKKDKRELKISWLLTILATLLGFFVNICANAFYDLVVDGYDLTKMVLFVVFTAVSLFFIGFFSFVFDKVTELGGDSKPFSYFIKEHLKTFFK